MEAQRREREAQQEVSVNVYWFDEATFSLKTEVGYSWFRPGQRPQIPVRITRSYTYAMAAADPETGDLFGLLVPWQDAESFQVFLDLFSKHLYELYGDWFESWLVVDQASWHTAGRLQIPKNIKIMVMPKGASLINPVEQLWLYFRDHYTRNKGFDNLDELEDTLSKAFWEFWDEPKLLQSVCASGIDPDYFIKL